MKRILLFSLLVTLFSFLNAQVFNTSSTLEKGQFSAGFEPGVYVNGHSDFNLYLYGGVGISNGIDLGLKLGVLGNTNFIGADVEFMLGKRFSISAGAHSWGDFGLDGTALYTFDLTKGVDLYTGLDLDIVFANEVQLPLWIPIGLQIGIKSNIAFLFETSINVTDYGAHWIGGGLNFFF